MMQPTQTMSQRRIKRRCRQPKAKLTAIDCRTFLANDRALRRFQVGLEGFHGGGFAAELELGAGREVLDVVVNVPGAGERLAVIDALAAGAGEGDESQADAAERIAHPNGRGLHAGSSILLLAVVQPAPM